MQCKLKKYTLKHLKIIYRKSYLVQHFCTFKSALKLRFPMTKQVKKLFPLTNLCQSTLQHTYLFWFATSFCYAWLVIVNLDYSYGFWHNFSCSVINSVVVCLFVNTYAEFCFTFLFQLSLTQMKYKYKHQTCK